MGRISRRLYTPARFIPLRPPSQLASNVTDLGAGKLCFPGNADRGFGDDLNCAWNGFKVVETVFLPVFKSQLYENLPTDQ
jgi:hypothetical protein